MTETTRNTFSIAGYVDGWSPEPVVTVDAVHRQRVLQLARTLDFDEARFACDDAPILAHWTAFTDWPATAELDLDGHPAAGHFLPPIPDRRRMFAGAMITALRPLRLDERTTQRISLESVTPKHGSTGEMLFVTTRVELEQGGVLCRSELQHSVYRSESSGPARTFDRGSAQANPSPEATWSESRSMSTPGLFRFSAVTSNTHRIHYDAPYTTEVEGYPGLVVHGPLTATLMADMVSRAWGESMITEFSFRLKHPLFVDDPFVVEGIESTDGLQAKLSVRSSAATIATATARRQ